MAVGDLKKAEEEAEAVYKAAKKGEWKQVSKLIALCYANILFMQGRIKEALELYEEGIQLSREANNHWDLNYGLIWRALCLAESGDAEALETLIQLKLM
jgi:tetratricopeptide (TPR) repeat protein